MGWLESIKIKVLAMRVENFLRALGTAYEDFFGILANDGSDAVARTIIAANSTPPRETRTS